MFLYLIILLFLIIFGLLLFYQKDFITNEKLLENNKKIFLIISFLILFIFMGFRSIEVGTDTKLYVSIFQSYSTKSWIDILFEEGTFFGFGFFNKFVSLFSTDAHAILIASSFLICFLTGMFIYRNSNHVVYSTLLFILFYHYLNSFNIFRQYVAIMIVANAFPFLVKGNTFKYILVCLLAITIHNTAIMSLFLFPLSKMKFNKTTVSMYSIVLLFTIFLVPIAMSIFAKFFPHYQMYFYDQYMNYSGFGLIILICIYCFISLLAFFLRNKNTNEFEKRTFLLLLLINNLAIITNIMSFKYFILYRVSLYYSIYLIIFIPMVFNRVRKNLILYLGFFLIMLFPFVNKLVNNDGQVVPYRSTIKILNK